MICKKADNCSKYAANYGNPYPHQSPCEHCQDYEEPELRRDASKILYQMYQEALDEIKERKFAEAYKTEQEQNAETDMINKLQKFKSILMNLDDMC